MLFCGLNPFSNYSRAARCLESTPRRLTERRSGDIQHKSSGAIELAPTSDVGSNSYRPLNLVTHENLSTCLEGFRMLSDLTNRRHWWRPVAASSIRGSVIRTLGRSVLTLRTLCFYCCSTIFYFCSFQRSHCFSNQHRKETQLEISVRTVQNVASYQATGFSPRMLICSSRSRFRYVSPVASSPQNSKPRPRSGR